MASPTPGGRPTRPPLALIAGCGFVLLVLIVSATNLIAAWALQARLGEEYAVGYAREALREPLSRGVADRSLRSAIDNLLRREDLGFRYLGVSDSEGVLLTHAGVLETLHIPMLSES